MKTFLVLALLTFQVHASDVFQKNTVLPKELQGKILETLKEMQPCLNFEGLSEIYTEAYPYHGYLTHFSYEFEYDYHTSTRDIFVLSDAVHLLVHTSDLSGLCSLFEN